MAKNWTAIVLAAGRGPNDPMAKAYGVSHKCALPVNGVPMLRRVVNALQKSQSITSITISIESADIVREAMAEKESGIAVMASENSAPLSASVAIRKNATFP
ncbi:MAG: NTP transferase domain-containing protein, partial [Aestuariivirga sp.]|nr:NTP transferase domain-containing protein [Aestuariivirga sp.]